MPLATRTLAADRGDAGRRIDLVVCRHLTDIGAATRTRVQAWIEGGRVAVNGRIVRRVSARAALGDLVTIEFPDLEPRSPVLAETVPIAPLFEDDHLLIVDKPAGMVSHPTYRHTAGTLVNALLGYAQRWPPEQRPSLVGRLDKQTSGAVVVAKTADAHASLQRTLASAHSDKSYLAVVYGEVAPRGEIRLHLRRHPDDRRLVMATDNEGRPSVTMFERLDLARFGDECVSLVRCRLVTGRMHQIRVHLSARSWPIVGDAKYGEPRWQAIAEPGVARVLESFPRQALHAWRLAFNHPVTGEPVAVEAPVPADMVALLQACGMAAGGRRDGPPLRQPG